MLNNKKLKDYLDAWHDGLKIIGVKTPPPATINELMYIYCGCQEETINATTVEILKMCGVNVKEKGIGWKIIN